MKTRVRPCCSRETFANEAEARRRLDRMTQLGLRSVLPIDVERCRNGWHLRFPRPDSGPSPKLRALVETRDKGCVRCGAVVARDEDSIHHRVPRGRGGENTAENLLLLCGSGTTGCHGWTEKNRAEAYQLGYLVHTGIDPLNVPVKLLGRVLAYPSPDGKWLITDGVPSDLDIPVEQP
ncbi:HNH endonuclease [Nonomuraea sp. NPDC059023]|uniref:HNH endonuclease n=1 Tax=unclassified Nonomuraea TaxID=2593643 RepID=UPI0036C8BACC